MLRRNCLLGALNLVISTIAGPFPVAHGAPSDPIGDLIKQLEERDQRLPSFFYQTSQPVEVFTQPKGGEPLTTLETDDLIPFEGVSGGRAVIKSDDYGMLYAETKGKVIRKDASETRMIDVFLDVPEGQPVTITSAPGKTWRDCGPSVPEGERPCVAWPKGGPQTRMQIRHGKIIEETDPVTGAKRPQLFYLVDVQYPTDWGTKSERGWLSAQYVRADPLPRSELSVGEVDYVAPRPLPKPDCNCKSKDLGKQIKEGLDVVIHEPNEAAKKAINYVGQCVSGNLNPSGYTNPFNHFMGSHWRNQKGKTLFRYKDQAVTGEKMFAIDAIARTIFGEMRGCFRNGIRYPMAVARVIMNRAYYVKKQGRTVPFVKATSPNYKALEIEQIVPYVTSSSAQFSPWNRDDPNLKHILCPKNMDAETKKIWLKSVEIATSAILDRKQFAQETKQVRQLHFSSGTTPNWARNYKLEKPSIGASPIDSGRCLKLWGSESSKTFRWQAFLHDQNPQGLLGNFFAIGSGLSESGDENTD
ncbi:MAG: hypothetical protein H6624_04310 [Bdellovibrionaceae bacterium]|nr:hypothetical protein [Pseudobdellovibrionaceae bacterium]